MPDSDPADLPGPIALVFHDAGAANLALGWIGRDIHVPVRPFMAGPAAQIWRSGFPDIPILSSIEECLSGAAALLSGTGWATDLEHRAREIAKTMGLRSLAVVDHWVNYAMRFERAGRIVYPDAIVTTDDWAYRDARRSFPQVNIVKWPNRFLEAQLEQIGPPEETGDILYLCEPARNDWSRGRPGEFQAIDFFLDNIVKLPGARGKPIRFRPHPSEEAEKYNAIIESVEYASLDDSKTLAQSISRAHLVGGMSSAAMIVALASGRYVFSTLPPWAPACSLPHDGIFHLRDLLSS